MAEDQGEHTAKGLALQWDELDSSESEKEETEQQPVPTAPLTINATPLRSSAAAATTLPEPIAPISNPSLYASCPKAASMVQLGVGGSVVSSASAGSAGLGLLAGPASRPPPPPSRGITPPAWYTRATGASGSSSATKAKAEVEEEEKEKEKNDENEDERVKAEGVDDDDWGKGEYDPWEEPAEGGGGGPADDEKEDAGHSQEDHDDEDDENNNDDDEEMDEETFEARESCAWTKNMTDLSDDPVAAEQQALAQEAAFEAAKKKAAKLSVSFLRYADPKSRLSEVLMAISGASMSKMCEWSAWRVARQQWYARITIRFMKNLFFENPEPCKDRISAVRACACHALAMLLPSSDFVEASKAGLAGTERHFDLFYAPKEPSPGSEGEPAELANGKSMLNEAMAKVSKVPLSGANVIYNNLHVRVNGKKVGIQSTLQLLFLPAELREEEWIGQVRRKRVDAENSAATAAMKRLLAIPGLMAVVSAPKRVKEPYNMRGRGPDAGVVNFQAREEGLKIYVEGGRRSRDKKQYWTMDINALTTLSSVRSMIKQKRIPAGSQWLFATKDNVIEFGEEHHLKATDFLPSLTLVPENVKFRKRSRQKDLPTEFGPDVEPLQNPASSRSRSRSGSGSPSGSSSRSRSRSPRSSKGKGRGKKGGGGGGRKGEKGGKGKHRGSKGPIGKGPISKGAGGKGKGRGGKGCKGKGFEAPQGKGAEGQGVGCNSSEY